jgi:hypothetical protein
MVEGRDTASFSVAGVDAYAPSPEGSRMTDSKPELGMKFLAEFSA